MSYGINMGESRGLPPDIDIELSELVKSLSQQSGIHNGVVALESLDETIHWSGGFGDADLHGTPMRPGTRYWIASVTKLYIATCVFRLIERGELALEDPVCALLPEDLYSGIHRLNGAVYTDMITVQHLLGHSSGLPDFIDESPEGEQSLIDQLPGSDQSWTTAWAIDFARQKLTPHFPPQQLDNPRKKIRYSDTNYQLLIAILEHNTGQPLAKVFNQFIYQPLGLSNTVHPEQLETDTQLARIWSADEPLDLPLALASFRDLTSTIPDQISFMRGLVDGGIFDRPATVYRMMGNWTSFGVSLNATPTAPSWPIQYGLGAMRFRIPRLFTPIKPVPGIMGHTGISGSWLFYCPEYRLILAGTVDQMAASAVPFRFLPKLLRTVGDAFSIR